MKNLKYLSGMIICFLLIAMTVSGTIIYEVKNNETTTYDKLIRILYSDPNLIETFISYGFEPLEIRDKDILVTASESDILWLDDMSYDYCIISHNNQQKHNEEMPNDLFVFHNYATMTAELQDIASTYPDIAVLYDLGQSVLGRTLWGLKITDNPQLEENEAEVRICGAHHGNEYMSVELPLRMAWLLVEEYGTDPLLTELVEEREIWIIPMVNPDGREAGNRQNANGVDLNRDYGYMWGGSGGSPAPFSQPETQIIREHALENNFVLSLSFHCSGDIVNYIWNYKGEPVADNAVVVMLSQQYGSHNGYWVVEGFDWYETRGDTNDFSYGCRGDIDWTIEVQNSGEQQAWDYNREAIIEIIDAANMGLTGIVTDAHTGNPLTATIWVEEAWWPCFTDPILGDYHKPLLPGTYTVHYQANGYAEQIHTIDVLSSPDPTVFDVSLYPANEYYAYQVTSCNFYDPYSYPSSFQNNPTEAVDALGPPNDLCASLGRGGVITLDMGEPIQNAVDNIDFRVVEGDGSADGYHVRASKYWNGPWVEIGSGFGTAEFDLADGPMDWAQFIEIRDDYDGNAYEQNPGCDIDAIENLALEQFILNLEDFPMYEAEVPLHDMCGPAVAQMTLNYIHWNSNKHPLEPPMTFDDQGWLYDRGLENNTLPGPELDLQGMWSIIQGYRPEPYSEYGYNFNRKHNSDQTEMLKQICLWINYTAGIKDGHPIHVPAAIPAYGDYTNWMAVRGIHTDQYAYPMPDELTVYGFWVNDPLPGGIGENSYKDINTFNADYYHTMSTSDYPGEYLAVLEPPEETEHCELNIAVSPPRFTPNQRMIFNVIQSRGITSSFERITHNWIIQAAIDGAREQLYPYDQSFATIFDQTIPEEPIYVQSFDQSHYYLVPFKLQTQETVVVIIISAEDGCFKEASWVDEPINYLPITSEEALAIALDFAESLDIDVEYGSSLPINLVHRQSTPYHPEWQIIIGNYGIYIGQDRSIDYIIFK